MKNKSFDMAISNFKYDSETGVFECYGNTKGNIDHAQDRTLDGAYADSISTHKAAGTMPKMYWNHRRDTSLPVGEWIDMREDSKGLWMKGKLSKSTLGSDIEILAKEGTLDSFSIGYRVDMEKWNALDKCNDLIKLDIIETSWVDAPCNEESRLVGIKSKLDDGELPSKRELQKFLCENGLSKRQSEKVTNKYSPDYVEKQNVFEMMSELS